MMGKLNLYLSLLYLSALLSITSPALSSEDKVLLLEDNKDGYPLGRFVEYYEDRGGGVGIEDIVNSKRDIDWKSHNHDALIMGFTDSIYWLRIKIKNPMLFQKRIVIENTYPLLKDITLFNSDGSKFLSNKNEVAPLYMGDFSQEYKNHLFLIDFPAALEKTLYFRVETDGMMKIPLILWSSEGFFNNASAINISYGVHCGFFAISAILALILCVFYREKSFLVYFFYILAFAVFTVTTKGVLFYNIGDINIEILERAVLVSFSVLFFLFLYFVQTFLNTRDKAKYAHKVLYIFSVWSILGGIGGFFLSFKASLLSIVLLPTLGAPLAFIVGVRSILNGYRPSRFFVLALSISVFNMVGLILEAIGPTPRSGYIELGALFLAALEISLFFLALMDRVKYGEKTAQNEMNSSNLELTYSIKKLTNQMKLQKEMLQDQSESIKQAKKSVEELEQKKKSFLRSISHEIKTPLREVSKVIEDSQGQDPENRFLGLIKESFSRLNRVCENIFDYKNLKIDKKVLELYPINIIAFSQICGEFFDLSCKKKNIDFKVTYNGKRVDSSLTKDIALYINGEVKALEKILYNILANALKYSNQDGNIELGIVNDTERNVVTIFVKDHGIGLSEVEKESLFGEKGLRNRRVNQIKRGGGLGLLVVEELVKAMNGVIGVEGEKGKGCTFSVEFSLCPSPKPVVDLLFVEDEIEILEMVEAGVKKRNRISSYRMASNAKEARRIIDEFDIKVIMSDAKMPGEDGASLLAYIAETQPQCRRYLCTGYTSTNLLQQAVNIGKIDKIFYKPLNLNEIFNDVETQIENSLIENVVELSSEDFDGEDWLMHIV